MGSIMDVDPMLATQGLHGTPGAAHFRLPQTNEVVQNDRHSGSCGGKLQGQTAISALSAVDNPVLAQHPFIWHPLANPGGRNVVRHPKYIGHHVFFGAACDQPLAEHSPAQCEDSVEGLEGHADCDDALRVRRLRLFFRDRSLGRTSARPGDHSRKVGGRARRPDVPSGPRSSATQLVMSRASFLGLRKVRGSGAFVNLRSSVP